MDVFTYLCKEDINHILNSFTDFTGFNAVIQNSRNADWAGNISSANLGFYESQNLSYDNAVIGTLKVGVSAKAADDDKIKSSSKFLADTLNDIIIKSCENTQNKEILDKFSEIISNFNEVVDKIKKDTKALDTIFQQQSLLTVNASVEAARAGQAGAGFAIVAQELGKFSEMSTKIYKDIEEHSTEIAKSLDIMNKYL